MKDALDVHRALLAQDVPHEIVRLPRVVLSADEIPEVLDLPIARCIATRMYVADDRLVAVLVRAGQLPHPAAVLSALRARTLRSAPVEVVNTATEFAASLVCPVLLPADTTVLADACVGHADVVYTATGDGGTALGIPSRSLLTVTRSSVAELCSPTSPTLDLLDGDASIGALTGRQRSWR
jgi:prolyl-tRNA editing enzyme YbaK/EbsC (Cys-tRNA(Pro) deacylase)